MAVRDSKATRVLPAAKRKSVPRLATATADLKPRRIEFKSQGRSTLGTLLQETAAWPGSFESSLPTLRYDPKLLREVIDCSAHEKGSLEESLAEMAEALVRTIRQIGMLMSSYDDTIGSVNDNEIIDLGFTIDGLADLAEQLLQARTEIADADTAERIGANSAGVAA